jgi:predicted PurR-regulated permease PerM
MVAALLACMFNPLVTRLEGWRVPACCAVLP